MRRPHSIWFVLIALLVLSVVPYDRLSAKSTEGVRREVVRSGQELLILTGHRADVYTAIFSPDGRYILTGGKDGMARLWDVRTSKLLQIFGDGRTPIEVVGFLPDGLRIFTSPFDGQMRLWDIRTGMETGQVGYIHCIRTAARANDHKCMLIADNEQNTQFIDMTTGKVIRQLGSTSKDARLVALSPDNQLAITCGGDGAVHLWNMQNGQRLHIFASRGSAIISVNFSPNGQYLATGSTAGMVQLWDVRTGREVRQFAVTAMGMVYSVTFSPNGLYLLTGSADGTARLWTVPVLI